MKLKSPYLIKPNTKVRLSHFRTDDTGGLDKSSLDDAMKHNEKKLGEFQELLFASQSKALLVVLQGMDTAGKDGTIRHIFAGVSPQGCQVAPFKVPTQLEQRHDFLWRCHEQVPPRGMIGIFNRSHYEDVLSPLVHGKISPKTAARHMEEINDWEAMLAGNDVVILKFFLHISREEQTRRLQARIDEKDKNWKLSPSDFEERPFWQKYMRTYESILSNTSRKHAPWFIIPADHKPYRNVAISTILVEALQHMKLKYPKPAFDPSSINLADETPEDAAREVARRVNPGVVSANDAAVTSGRK